MGYSPELSNIHMELFLIMQSNCFMYKLFIGKLLQHKVGNICPRYHFS